MSTYTKKIKLRPETAQNNNRRYSQATSECETYSLCGSQISGNRNGNCQWTNKVQTQMNSLSRYKLDFQNKRGLMKDLPQIKMSLYDDQKFKEFLNNNFLSMTQKDYKGPPEDFKPQQAFKPQQREESRLHGPIHTTYNQNFKQYKLDNPDKWNKPMPDNISLHKSKICAVSHYRSHFNGARPSTTKPVPHQQNTSIPFHNSLPLYNSTEH